MYMTSVIQVHWRGINVVSLDKAVPDMWYLEGDWEKMDGLRESDEFESLVKGFDAKTILADPTKGTKVLLVEGSSETHALVLTLAKGKLMVRRVVEPNAIVWLNENVL